MWRRDFRRLADRLNLENLKKSDAELSDPTAVTNSLAEQLQTAILQVEAKQSENAIGMSLLNERVA